MIKIPKSLDELKQIVTDTVGSATDVAKSMASSVGSSNVTADAGELAVIVKQLQEINGKEAELLGKLVGHVNGLTERLKAAEAKAAAVAPPVPVAPVVMPEKPAETVAPTAEASSTQTREEK